MDVDQCTAIFEYLVSALSGILVGGVILLFVFRYVDRKNRRVV